MSAFPDREDDRLRFGMDPPRLEEREYWESLEPGADERAVAIFQAEAEAMYERSKRWLA